MTTNRRILGIAIGAWASIIAGCTAEQGETTNEAVAEQGIAVAEQGTTGSEHSANPSEDTAEAAPLAGAPACVERTMLAQRSLYVHNNCGNRQRVKVIIRTGPDSDCFSIDPNQTKVVNWAWPGTFDRLDSC
ncbi:hypothetical protein LVJ94_27540 [Pendulispora rubella]|uniref:Secreted protein n=1 Tax=Pendulispora rubella TaxID=2741070 RepID=A0ABZ2KQ62_9BACT